MSQSPGPAGKTYAGPAERVDRARHHAYAAAVGVHAPEELDHPLACYASVYLLWPLVPQLFADPELNLDLTRLLHGEQEFWFQRPVEFEEVLRPEGVIERFEQRRGMLFLEFHCRGLGVGTETVAQSRSLFVIPGPG
jgi:hypothetical protein